MAFLANGSIDREPHLQMGEGTNSLGSWSTGKWICFWSRPVKHQSDLRVLLRLSKEMPILHREWSYEFCAAPSFRDGPYEFVAQ